jgi:hypothetical protein
MNETFSPNKYFLGDPAIVLPNKIYHGIWGQQHGHQNGKYTIYDNDFIVHNTYSGDGTFFDTKNRSYVIESGMIGLVSYDLIEDKTLIKNNGHVFDFTEQLEDVSCERFQFIYSAGIFCVRCNKKVIMINTKIESDFNSDEEEIESAHSKEENGEQNEDISVNQNINDNSEEEIENEEDTNEINNTVILEKKRLFLKKKRFL